MPKGSDIKTTLKQLINKRRLAKDVSDRDTAVHCRELIKVLWSHRHSDLPVSVLV